MLKKILVPVICSFILNPLNLWAVSCDADCEKWVQDLLATPTVYNDQNEKLKNFTDTTTYADNLTKIQGAIKKFNAKGISIAGYVATQAPLEQAVRTGYENYDKVKTDLFTLSDKKKKLAELFLAYWEAGVLKPQNIQNAKNREVLGLQEATNYPDTSAVAAKNKNAFIREFNNQLSNATDAERADLFSSLKNIAGKLTAGTPSSYTAKEIIDNAPSSCDTTCMKEGYLAGILSTGHVPTHIEIPVEKGLGCTMKNTIYPLANSILGLVGTGCMQKKSAESRMSCEATVSTLRGGDSLNQFNQNVSDIKSLNMAMATKYSGSPSSIKQDTTTIPDGSDTWTAQSASGTGAGMGASTSGTGSSNYKTSGFPNDGRFSYPQVASYFDSATPKISSLGSGASDFNNKYKDYSYNIGSYNSDLVAAISSNNTKIVDRYTTSATNAQNILNTLSGTGGRYTQTTDSTITYLKGMIDNERNQVNSNLSAKYDIANRNYANQIMLQCRWCLSQEEKGKLMKTMTDDAVNAQILQIENKIFMNDVAKYQEILVFNYNYKNEVYNDFDIYYMYAANGKAVGPRSLKLKNIKTPIKYQLKEGWQDILKEYIKDMMKQAEQAKREMNNSKSRIRQLLAKKVNIIPLELLPDLDHVTYEARNMETFKRNALRNMQAIDKAMAYHKKRKDMTPREDFAKYETEEKVLKKSMNETVKVVDSVKDDVNKAQRLLSDMYVEIPKAEALRLYAKKMVEEGK